VAPEAERHSLPGHRGLSVAIPRFKRDLHLAHFVLVSPADPALIAANRPLSRGKRRAVNRRSLKSKLVRLWTLTRCAARYWNDDNSSNTGAALAFYCAFSIAPLLVILLTISGFFLGERSAYGQIGTQLSALFGPSTAKTLLGAAHSAEQTRGTFATVVSVVTLLIGATTVLAALQQALEQIWRSAAMAVSGVYGWLRTRLLSFGFILTLGFLLLVSLTISTALTHLRTRMAAGHPALVGLFGLIDTVVSLLVVSGLFALIYRYMPARRLQWLPVVLGGVLTAVLFDIGRWVVGLYLSHSTQPSAYGAASSFAALLLWLYYTSQIFLFGAEFTACLGGVREQGAQQGRIGGTDAKPSRAEAPR
jgi:membrane protein